MRRSVSARRRGKHVVTANKDLIADQGPLRAGRLRGVALRYEAAACGAIPSCARSAIARGRQVLAIAGDERYVHGHFHIHVSYEDALPRPNASATPR